MKLKKFKTSQWILIVIIMSLGQLLIHYYSTQVMSGSEVINYVSFAGTIVSIILAVLAIVYSFYQSFTQQNNVDSISREIERLKETAIDIKVSSNSIKKASKFLPKIVDELSSLPNIVSDRVTEKTDHLLKAHNNEIKEHLAKFNSYEFAVENEVSITPKFYAGLGYGEVMLIHTCLAMYMLVVLNKPTDIFDILHDKVDGGEDEIFNLIAGANSIIYSLILAGVFYFNDEDELNLIDSFGDSLSCMHSIISCANSNWLELKEKHNENDLLKSLSLLFDLIPSDEDEIKGILSKKQL
ncbi:hypothetical protein JD499_15755 [Aeromonas enteropelogenes]|uniref:hypothetical protein n=1 Tax=Aeromonas enteropelogenes TaxID=29489 RepID=UPI00192019C9|nr:hypothetical protein [Aeromonas enteropelogenes]MBL0458638.1 hypothetical protein [Aeromonas enteropelogenes]